MTLELSMYFLSGVLFVVCCLIGVIWNQKNEEIKEHSRLLDLKANNDKLSELDRRMERDMENMAKANERLIEKLEVRHDRELEAVSTGFREQIGSIKDQIKTMETNILKQMEFMFNSVRDKQ